MAFIFGIISLNRELINTEDVHKLCDAVKWDHFDEYIDIHDQYSIGYCWNKDRNPKAGIYRNEDLTVIADARIYNEDTLHKEITFTSPEEAFAKAYLKWGKQCPDKFNGDFSVLIIDHKHQEIILFRDHIGARPLCYTITENKLIFASHQFGIAKSHLINNVLSKEKFAYSFFLTGKKQKYYLTVFQNILKIIPGYTFTISPLQTNKIQYWCPEKIKQNRKLTMEQTISQLCDLLIKATRKRIEPCMIGAHVSGGIDSSGVAAILCDHIEDKNKLIGYSWSPENFAGVVGKFINEKELIADFSEKKKMLIKYYTWDEEHLIEDITEPEFEVMYLEKQTMRQAKKDNIEILFSGWGGDEFVSLSISGALNYIILHFKFKALYQWIKHFGIRNTIGRIKNDIVPVFIPTIFYKKDFIKIIFRLFKKSFIFKHWKQLLFEWKGSIYGFGNRKKLMLDLLYNYHIPRRMDSWALFGEKYGLEYKYPLLDKELLEFWFSIPVEYTYNTLISRHLYREALKDILPEKIRTRPDKQEGAMQKNNNKFKVKFKKESVKQEFLFTYNPNLSFYKSKELQKLILEEPPLDISGLKDRLQFNLNFIYLQYYLRNRKVCEKYIDNN